MSIILRGTNADDTLTGASADYKIYGRNGDDTISMVLGNSTISGGRGNDLITMTLGDGIIYGGKGDDTIDASVGHYNIRGGSGNDSITAVATTGIIRSGAGDDSLQLYNSDNITVRTGNGNDLVNTGTLGGVIKTGNGNDTVDSWHSDHLLINTGRGDDYIIDRFGDVTIHSGQGEDYIYINGDITPDAGWQVVNAGTGNDTIEGFNAHGEFRGGAGDDVMDFVQLFDPNGETPYSFVFGGNGNDTITASQLHADFRGGNGHDHIEVIGGSGSISGGNGDDFIGVDLPTNSGGIGGFSLIASVGRTIRAGRGDDTVYSSTGNDDIRGGQGNDIIYSASGNDTVYAGSGNDWVNGEVTFVETEEIGTEGGGLTLPPLGGLFGSGQSFIVEGGLGLTYLAVNTTDIEVHDYGLDFGDDVFNLGAGDDFIAVGIGSDVATLGSGADSVFLYNGSLFSNGGNVNLSVTDFNLNEDTLIIDTHLIFGEYSTIAFYDSVFTQVGDDAHIVAGDVTVALEGINIDDLAFNDIIFV